MASAEPSREICIQLEDHSSRRLSAASLLGAAASRDPHVLAARLADQFLAQNRARFAALGVSLSKDFDGNDVTLRAQASGYAGAVPLISPLSGKDDFGLVVQPRFPWPGIGPMLGEMGWRVVPAPLDLPLLRRSARQVPQWVLASMVLARLERLLEWVERRFEADVEERPAPKGTVLWQQYATRSFPRAQLLAVPCRYSDLREDRLLKGAIRYTLEWQIRSLETQREHGGFVHRLISLAESLVSKVRSFPARRPHPLELDAWMRRPFRPDPLIKGLQAVEWTVEERGLAGPSDLEGIPWRMPMDAFFEAWVETVLRALTAQIGGNVKAGRLQETVAPISWDPPYFGSQKSLRPDFVVEFEGVTFIVDAKYKRHWEEIHQAPWETIEDQLREEHRRDLLQVLAYANLSVAPTAVCCLAYPCSEQTWNSLRARQRVFSKASIPARGRRLDVWLTAIPMLSDAKGVAALIAEEVREILRTAA